MTPELIQYCIYGGLVVGGWLLRHYGISLPLLPKIEAAVAPTAPAALASPLAAPTVAQTANNGSVPALSAFPRLSGLLSDLGPTADALLSDALNAGLADLKSKAKAPAPAAPTK